MAWREAKRCGEVWQYRDYYIRCEVAEMAQQYRGCAKYQHALFQSEEKVDTNTYTLCMLHSNKRHHQNSSSL
jgi:hypothetical protein